MANDTRIAFFSGGVKERNEALVTALLSKYYGAQLDNLKKSGQFEIFSRNHLTVTSMYCGGVKDLNTVLRKEQGETMNDIILIDDWPDTSCHKGQDRGGNMWDDLVTTFAFSEQQLLFPWCIQNIL